MHVASPFILELPSHEDDLIRPAVDGVRNVLAAAGRQSVSCIVQTSSIASIMYGHAKSKNQFTSKDWTNLSHPGVSAYSKSKTMAEMEFWEFSKKNPDKKCVSICPGLVFGPILSRDAGTSVEILVRMLQGKYPGVPRLGFPTVDVRDVAALHWDAFENPLSAGKRYPAIAESLWFREIAEKLRQVRPEFKSKVKSLELPDWFVRIFAWFDKPTRMVLNDLGFMPVISGEAESELGFRPLPVAESIRDSVESILKMGLVANPA
jgi:dihydroflavonol-4-reductase